MGITANLACAYCFTEIDDPGMACKACGAEHHLDCWADGQGCATVGCVASPSTHAESGGSAASSASVSPPSSGARSWSEIAAMGPITNPAGAVPKSPTPAVPETSSDPAATPAQMATAAPPSAPGQELTRLTQTSPATVSSPIRRRGRSIIIVLLFLVGGSAGIQFVANLTGGSVVATAGPAMTSSTPAPPSLDPTERRSEQEWAVTIPDVVDMDYDDAHFELRSADLNVIRRRVESSRPAGTVISQSPAAGREVDADTNVRLSVAVPRADADPPPPVHSNATSDDIVAAPSTPTWIVVLNSLATWEYDRVGAAARATGYRSQGIEAHVLLSDDYSSLNAGYWVVYTGQFASDPLAAAHCRSIRWAAPECYQRYTAR